MATRHNLTIRQASTYRLVVQVADGPADLSGFTAEMTIRATKTSTSALAYMGPELFEVEPLTRQVILEVPDEATALYDWPGEAPYDLYLEGPAGDRWRLIEGLATLSKTVTREA